MKYNVAFSVDFRRNPFHGQYIAFEGIDGAGKTVQAERLAMMLREQKKDVHMVSEPRRNGIIGRVINEFLQKRVTLPPVSLQYLFSADRISHQEEIILPALKKGQTVISHRCFWSAVPYGIMDRSDGGYNVDLGNTILVAQSILSMYFQVVVPDITFYLDISSETALERLREMGTVMEYYETKEKLEKVRNGYKWMIEKFPKEFTVIDGEREIDEITDDILKISNFMK